VQLLQKDGHGEECCRTAVWHAPPSRRPLLRMRDGTSSDGTDGPVGGRRGREGRLGGGSASLGRRPLILVSRFSSLRRKPRAPR
jgi:hypothetical protein